MSFTVSMPAKPGLDVEPRAARVLPAGPGTSDESNGSPAAALLTADGSADGAEEASTEVPSSGRSDVVADGVARPTSGGSECQSGADTTPAQEHQGAASITLSIRCFCES